MIYRKRSSYPSPERWIVSYADFVTLLFAFFVVLYAAAQTSHAKAKEVSDSVRRALDSSPARNSVPQAKTASLREPDALATSFDYLKRQLHEEIASGKIQVTREPRGIVIGLRERAFFPSGGDGIYPSAFDSMAKVASIIRSVPNSVRLEGHTDSVPIHNDRFRSNWSLSAARSIAVLSLFETRYGIPSRRFAIAGYADNLPVAGNDSEEGRAQNRRVDIVILSGRSEAAG